MRGSHLRLQVGDIFAISAIVAVHSECSLSEVDEESAFAAGGSGDFAHGAGCSHAGERFRGIGASCSHLKMGAKCHREMKPLAGHLCLTSLCHSKVASHLASVLDSSGAFIRRKSQLDKRKQCPSKRIPESQGMHVHRARADVSISKMLSVICLVETHRWAG